MSRNRLRLPASIHRNVPFLLLACWFLSLTSGCGTGAYEERVSRCVRKITAAGGTLQIPIDVPGTKLLIQIPDVFPNAPTLAGTGDPRRANPSAPLPSHKLTYEAFITDGAGGQQPYYLYVGAVTGQPLQQVATEIQTAVKAAQLTAAGDWADFQGKTADGGNNSWRKLRATGPQTFYYKNKEGQETFPSIDGSLEVYLHEEAGTVVIVAWRMPTSIEGNAKLSQWAPRVAGSVRSK